MILAWHARLSSISTHERAPDYAPDDRQVSRYGFLDFTDEEIHVRAPHSNTHDRNRNTLVTACYCRELALRRELKRLGLCIQETRNSMSSGWGPYGDLDCFRDTAAGVSGEPLLTMRLATSPGLTPKWYTR